MPSLARTSDAAWAKLTPRMSTRFATGSSTAERNAAMKAASTPAQAPVEMMARRSGITIIRPIAKAKRATTATSAHNTAAATTMKTGKLTSCAPSSRCSSAAPRDSPPLAAGRPGTPLGAEPGPRAGQPAGGHSAAVPHPGRRDQCWLPGVATPGGNCRPRAGRLAQMTAPVCGERDGSALRPAIIARGDAGEAEAGGRPSQTKT
mmetsp:Transcript_64767/g.192991  ORF Transcript_64767/g.192991 Transcript_64767/m.192991 type:complete len:205 (+) Transcript_64767:2195-2809(+)